MGIRYDDDDKLVTKKNPAVLFAQVFGLLAVLAAVVLTVYYILARGGAFEPAPREKLVKGLPHLRPALYREQVEKLLGKPREKTGKEFIKFLTDAGLEKGRVTLSEPPAFLPGNATAWQPPKDPLKLTYLDDLANRVVSQEATVTFKGKAWEVTIIDPTQPAAPAKGDKGKLPGKHAPGVPAFPEFPKNLAEAWVYYHQAIKRPRSEDGPIDLIVLLVFENGSLVRVIKGEVDLRGLPKPGGGTF